MGFSKCGSCSEPIWMLQLTDPNITTKQACNTLSRYIHDKIAKINFFINAPNMGQIKQRYSNIPQFRE